MDDPRRNSLAVEMGELLDQMEILDQHRAMPAVREFWLSSTGMPWLVVRLFRSWLMARVLSGQGLDGQTIQPISE